MREGEGEWDDHGRYFTGARRSKERKKWSVGGKYGTSSQGQQGFTTDMVMRLITHSRANGGTGKISNWMCDEHTTTDKGNKKKTAMIEKRGGEGDNGEVSGGCERERVSGTNMDTTSTEREGARRGRN